MTDTIQTATTENADRNNLLVQDRATAHELLSVSQERRDVPEMPEDPRKRKRFLYQADQHVENLLDFAFALRDAERKERHFDNVSALTEAIWHLKQTQAHLRRVSQRLYSKDPEDFASYK